MEDESFTKNVGVVSESELSLAKQGNRTVFLTFGGEKKPICLRVQGAALGKAGAGTGEQERKEWRGARVK